MDKKNQILTHEQIVQKIRRIAYEITECNITEKEVLLVGIVNTGHLFAELLAEEILKIKQLTVSVSKLKLDKIKPDTNNIELDLKEKDIEGKTIILIDDVLSSGQTMAYCLLPFLNGKVKSLQTATLIDRDHKDFPIKVDYIGYGLSTTLNEHIEVNLDDKKNMAAFLN